MRNAIEWDHLNFSPRNRAALARFRRFAAPFREEKLRKTSGTRVHYPTLLNTT